MIEIQTATVFYAPTKRRRYFSKSAAINAEAKAIILKKYPSEEFEPETSHSYHIFIDEPERYEKMHKRLTYKLKLLNVSEDKK